MTKTIENNELRCFTCGSLLGKARIAPGGFVEIKCKCRSLNRFEVKPEGQQKPEERKRA